jgi:hypothetical protein
MKNHVQKERHRARWRFPVVGALVLAALGALWSFHSRPTNSGHIQDADMIGIFVAQTGAWKFKLALNKSHALRSVLVEPDGYTLTQKTGWWKLVRQPDGQQQLEYDGLIHRLKSCIHSAFSWAVASMLKPESQQPRRNRRRSCSLKR